MMMNVKYPFVLRYVRYVAYDFSIFLNKEYEINSNIDGVMHKPGRSNLY